MVMPINQINFYHNRICIGTQYYNHTLHKSEQEGREKYINIW